MLGVSWPAWSKVLARWLLYAVMAMAAVYSVQHGIFMLIAWDGWGWDARAYYDAWSGGLYERAPGIRGAYNYSPLFAQLVWPLTLLPWPVFCAVFVGSAFAGVVWLCRPLPLPLAGLMLPICSVQVMSGNIDWLVAVLAVVGLGRGAPWVLAAVTKVTLCLGPVWFLARGEWRQLAGFAGAVALVVGASVAASPGLWVDWFRFLTEYAGDNPGMFALPPWPVRLAAAVALTVYAARRDRAWLLPVALLVAAPVFGTGPWALLAAIPRLRERDRTVREGRPDVRPDPTPAAASSHVTPG